MKSGFAASAVVAVCAASSAWAGLVNPLTPSWRGSANTMFMGWDVFTSAYAGANAADMAGSSTLATLFSFGPGSILTSTAPMPTGIYNATGPLSIMIMGGVTSAPRNPTEIVMNVASAGSGISNASVAITLFDNAGNSRRFTPATTSTRSSAPDGFGGTAVTTAFSFTIDALAWNCTRWQADFSSAAPHALLDAVSLDMNFTTPVPGPGALSVLAALLPGATRGRRRRR